MARHNLIQDLFHGRELVIDGQSLRFPSAEVFSFCLAGRTGVSSQMVQGLIGKTAAQLELESRTIKDLEKRLMLLLSKTVENPEYIGQQIRQLDMQVFSQENDWRDIFQALNAQGKQCDDLRRLALVKYVQYLASRQSVIKALYREKKRPEPIIRETSLAADEALGGTIVMPPAPAGGGIAGLLDEEPASELSSNTDRSALSALPKGEPVVIQFKDRHHMTLFLSKHRFSLYRSEGGAGPALVDEASKSRYPLSPGKNSVGRELSCSIAVDPSMRDVSRRHLLIETGGEGQFRLTDLSSHGTMVPSMYLRH